MIDLKPRMPIRRFDVFAEYNRIKNEAAGLPEDQAKGDAVWLAKVVAGRRFGSRGSSSSQSEEKQRPERKKERNTAGYRSAGGVPQTDRTFETEIIDRMGTQFYRLVFRPAVARAFDEGKKYEDIRDVLRAEWT